jgi:hypothetical protein
MLGNQILLHILMNKAEMGGLFADLMHGGEACAERSEVTPP